MTLETIVRKDVVTASPDTGVRELATAMREETVGSVVIVEEERPVGLVTDRDLTVRILGGDWDPETTTARDVMTSDPVTVPVEAGIFELTEIMEDAEVRRIPVVDGERLAGIVTLDDLYRLLVDELDNLGDVVEAESPPY